MSIAEPIFGIDVHPQYQRGFDFERALGGGYKFGFIKVSEGPYRDGTVWSHPELGSFVERAQNSGLLVGYYHFLVESDGDDPERGGRIQAELFWRRVQSFGGASGRLLCVDFEEYSPKYSWLTPSNATLKAFNGRLNELSGNHPLILYSGSGFWNGGDSSGEFDQYDADVLWEARYPDLEVMPRPREEYQSLKDWGWKGFGGEAPVFWQFTPAGTVAGMNIDVNAYRLPINHLRSLAVTPLPNENEEPNGVQPRSRGNELMRTVDEVAEYGMAHVRAGVRYWCWDQGNLDFPRPTVGRPASVDGKAPVPGRAKRGFCADLISWQLRKAGLPIPKNRFGNENYDGGTRSFRLRYKSVMKPFKLSECRRGDVIFVDFQTPWAPEGHIAFCLGDGPEAKLLQSHLDATCAVGEPGFNAAFTLAQSNSMPTGKNYYTHRIPREEIWG